MKKEKLIELILEYGIIETNFKTPITFKSGIKSPIYCDFRRTRAYPDLNWLIIESLVDIFRTKDFDVVMSVYSGAATYGEGLSYELELPSAYVRPDSKIKDYGLGKLIEGASVVGKKIFLIEDLVSTAGSIIENAQIIKKSGATDVLCVPIFSYEMQRSKEEFLESGLDYAPLLTISDLLPFLKLSLSENEYESLVDWISDPEGWFDRHKTEFDFGFLTQLRQSAKKSGSIICFGQDPVLEALPVGFEGIQGYVNFMEQVFMEMKIKGLSPGMFKPNLAWWQDFDEPFERNYIGSNCLVKMIGLIYEFFPGIPVCIDFKKGDIGTSSTKWASYGFEKWKADAVTVHSYMGSDSVGPFTDYCNNEKSNGAYLLVKTTNKGAADLELKKMADGRFVYEQTADNVISWAKGKPGVGAVTAGNSPENLMVLGKKFAGKDIPLLIPGVGKSQGGDAGEVATILRESGYELALARINLSSGLTHPWYTPGQPNPPVEECIDLIVNTLTSLNEKVGYIG